MFQPARLKRAMVASCRLPLGMPRRSLLAIGGLQALALGLQVDGTSKTTDRSFVANQAVAFHFDPEQDGVVVAIGGGGDDAQPIAAGLAFHPQLLARAAPEGHEA